jgi:hypothetical protein
VAAEPLNAARSAKDQQAAVAGRIVGIDRHAVMDFIWRWIGLVVALGILHIVLADGLRWNFAVRYLQLLDLDSEKSLPAWFSSLLLLAGGGLAAVHAWIETGRDDRMARHWGVLAIIFVCLSLDEEAAIHEKLSTLLHGAHLDGFFKFSWVIIAAPLVLAGGFYFIPFLRRLPSPIGRRIFVAGCIYVGAAIGVEMIGGYIVTHYGRGWMYWTETVIEESGEMIGAALFISAQLLSLERYCPPVTLRFLRRGD